MSTPELGGIGALTPCLHLWEREGGGERVREGGRERGGDREGGEGGREGGKERESSTLAFRKQKGKVTHQTIAPHT